MKYIVSVDIESRIDVEVEANSFEEAEQLAVEVYKKGYTNWTEMKFIGCHSVNAKDENGESVVYFCSY